ncbi:MAG: hypothetical protein CM15mP75_2350 [Flammeovirgaceae bacterium]|nr:MAG: hypothetical protein CM15mP75_2350 [Flammeovirgaceae bacterium]
METYTDYKLSNELKFYNQTKYRKEFYGYEDMNLSLNFNFYDSFSDNIATQDSFKIKNISNRIGIKGNSKLFNYDIYGNFGYFKYHVNALENSFSEIYVGGLLKYKNPSFDVVSNFEIKKSSDYRLKVDLKSKIFEASYLSALYEPKIFERIYLGNHYSWENNFNSSFVNNLNAKINLENRFITFSPSINFYTIKDHIYFVGDNHLQADQVITFNQFIV